MPTITSLMAINNDRYVTPTQTWPSGAETLGVTIGGLDDASVVKIEVAPQTHAFNYPYAQGAKPVIGDAAAGTVLPQDYAAAGIVAEFRFDDADGTTIKDQVTGLVLTEQGNPTYQVSAATPGLGKGVTYDGTADAHDALIATIPSGMVPTTGDFTIEVVGKYTNASIGAGDTIIACRTGADGIGWQIQFDANQHLDVHIEDEDGEVAQEGSTDLATDSIVHLLCSFDRDGNLVTYVNGASNVTTDISSAEKTVRPAAGASNRLSIGGDAARTAGDCLFGDIYFVRLYNRALTAAEALQSYNVLMNQGYPGWSPLLDQQDGDDLVICASGSNPGFYDLTPYKGALKSSAFRIHCATPQTTTPAELTFAWIYS